jgi:hypothetical protein
MNLKVSPATASVRASIAFLLILLWPILFSLNQTHSFAQSNSFFEQLKKTLQANDSAAYLALVSRNPESQKLETEFIQNFVAFHSKRTEILLAAQSQTALVLHVFTQHDDEARFESWAIKTTEEDGKTVISEKNVISSVTGLYQLRMRKDSIPIRNFQFEHMDALFLLEKGNLFLIQAGNQIAGALFVGDAKFQFTPPDPTEQQQLRLFCKQPRLYTEIKHLYIRSSTNTLKRLFGDLIFKSPVPDESAYERAVKIAQDSNKNAFAVRVPLSEELWFPQIQGRDLYSEIETPEGLLVYQYAPNEVEEILLAEKEKDRIICLYPEVKTPAINLSEGDFFKVLSYKMNLTFNPTSNHLASITEIRLLNYEPDSSSLVFKLNPTLRVSRIESDQGALIYFQEKSTNNIHVVLNKSLGEADELLLRFFYQGKIDPEEGRSEAQISSSSRGEKTEYYLPPTYLYSNASQWYPQLVSRPYSQVETSVSVPSDYAVIANGKLTRTEAKGERMVYSYVSDSPVKYFSLLVGRLNGNFTYNGIVPLNVFYYAIDKATAQAYAKSTDKILRFYSDYFGPYPYQNLNLALRPADEPGGHAPATIVIANRVFSYFQLRFSKDPLYIPEFPDFLLAHEIAHQWWGQAVGWQNYRDQWLSEGFAQFAAAEYIRAVYGDEAWLKISRIFYKWIADKTNAGPIILGSRLGRLINDRQAYSALLYNKGAYVLNMLKIWMGPEDFKKSMAEFYKLYRFKRAGIPDFEEIAQQYSNDDLSPFFQQWLYGWDIPAVTWKQEIVSEADGSLLKLDFQQKDKNFYRMKIPVEARAKDGRIFRVLSIIETPLTRMELHLPFDPVSVNVDPLHENLAKITEAS